MKKVLLFSLITLVTTLAVFAYETIIIKYPAGERWEKAYYKKVGNEAILQYVPNTESRANWNRTIIIHSYFDSQLPIKYIISRDAAKMRKMNPSGKYSFIKITPNDAMITRCTDDYKDIKAQCEFYRITNAHNGIVSIHYINRNKDDFKANYYLWYEIIKNAKLYNTYYRDERILDKAEYFELW